MKRVIIVISYNNNNKEYLVKYNGTDKLFGKNLNGIHSVVGFTLQKGTFYNILMDSVIKYKLFINKSQHNYAIK